MRIIALECLLPICTAVRSIPCNPKPDIAQRQLRLERPLRAPSCPFLHLSKRDMSRRNWRTREMEVLSTFVLRFRSGKKASMLTQGLRL